MKTRKITETRHPEYFAEYDKKLDQKQIGVVDRKRVTKDVNPMLKINYEGKSFKDSKGPIKLPLKPLSKGEKRARVLFVMIDQHDPVPKWTFGPGYLAAVLLQNDYDVKVFHGTAFHWGVDRLGEMLETEEKFDYIGFGFLSNYIHSVIEHIQVCRAVSPDSKIILGANGFTPLPAFYLAKTGADYGVSGEAETSLLNLLNVLTIGQSPEGLPSVSFREGKDIFVSQSREAVPDIKDIPWPAYDLFPIERYIYYKTLGYKRGRLGFHILTSRGCPYRCNFCTRLEEGIRARPFEDVFAEMRFLNEKYGISHFLHSDELFMVSPKYVKEFCIAMIDAMDDGTLPRVTWATTGRFNIVDGDVARVMSEAGCDEILFGLESGDTSVLELMNKKTSEEIIVQGINATKKYGMSVQLPCMFGNIGETPKSIRKTVEILIEHSPREYRTVRPVTPYPGSPLYQYALDKGLLKDHEHFFQLSRNPDEMTVNFTEMDNETYHRTMYDANNQLIDSYYEAKKQADKDSFKNLYFGGDDSQFVPTDHRNV
jgi:anaerobic magnesium-protoporphyrin IX monomethyl ester cyclase